MISIRNAATHYDLQMVEEIQLTVFNLEQGIPVETCRDGNDIAVHVLAFDGDQAVATGRIIIDDHKCAEIARIAVLASYRGDGIGGEIVNALEKLANEAGVRELSLKPHQRLERFYGQLGYRCNGNQPEVVAGHSLTTMVKTLIDD